jgi:hypothetical protein
VVQTVGSSRGHKGPIHAKLLQVADPAQLAQGSVQGTAVTTGACRMRNALRREHLRDLWTGSVQAVIDRASTFLVEFVLLRRHVSATSWPTSAFKGG